MASDLPTAIRIARGMPIISKQKRGKLPRMVAILSDGRLAFYGENSFRQHPFAVRYLGPFKPCLHAELDALRKAVSYYTKITGKRRADTRGIDLSGYSLSIARVLVSGEPANAKPCSGCTRAISDLNVGSVRWTE